MSQSHLSRTTEFRNLTICVTSCVVTLAAAPLLLRAFGAPLVAAAPVIVTLGAFVRRRVRQGWWARSALAGLSAGFAGIFSYSFSPPVLERIGHELGWPGQSLRLWERFTSPVFAGPCTDPRFWKVFETWDTWVRMLTRQSLISATTTLTLIAVILFGISRVCCMNRRGNHRDPGTSTVFRNRKSG